MSTQIILAKFVPDPARWEPRNIGIVVLSGQEIRVRFLCEKDDGSINGRQVRYSVGAPTETYKEWVRYWRRVLVSEGRDPLDLPRVEGSSFFLAKAGEIWAGVQDTATVDDLLSEYFARLVQPTEEGPATEHLKVRADRVIIDAGIADQPAFQRDIELPSHDLTRKESYRFPYSYRNGHLVVGRPVPLVEMNVHDALWHYQHIDSTIRKVSFVQGLGETEDSAAVGLLEEMSTVIDVNLPDAALRTREAFLGDGSVTS